MRGQRTKASEAVAYLARELGEGIPSGKASALCYAADRVSLRRHGHPMFGSSYSVGAEGPECAAVAVALARDGVDDLAGEELGELSVANEGCLDEAVARFGRMDPYAFSEWMSEPGNLPEWDGTDVAPTLEAVMAAVGVPDPAGQAAFERETEALHESIDAL